MFKSGVGVASGDVSSTVGANAVTDALKGLDGAKPSIVFVFASVKYDQQDVIKSIRSIVPDAPLVGASTAGEISGAGPAREHSVVVTVISSDSVIFQTATGSDIKSDAKKAGEIAANAVKARLGEKIRFGILFADGLSGNGSDVVRGVLAACGPHFPLVGGSAGDDAKYKQTFQYFDDQVFTNAAVFIGVGGNVEFSFGVNHGWLPVGMPMKVTKSDGAILKELDGRPAISLYEDYFGPAEAANLKEKTLADLALSYPLGIVTDNEGEFLLRAPFFVNADGSIVCGGEVAEGSDVRLMMGNKEDAIEAAKRAAHHARQQLTADPELVLIFSCHVRDKLYGTKEAAHDEINAIQQEVGPSVPLSGFYTYAEQAPVGGESRNIEKCNPSLHNETVVVCLMREAASK
jgi:hypothetical protein